MKALISILTPVMVLLHCLILPAIGSPQEQMRKLGDVSDVFFLDNQHGWASLSNRQTVYSTDNGGRTWSPHSTPTGLSSITFITPDTGWALGGALDDDSKPSICIFQTTNAGQVWNRVSCIIKNRPNTGGYLNHILFLDPQRGYVIGVQKGGNSIVFSTNDGGKTLSEVESLSGIFGASRGIFADKSGGVWITGNDYLIFTKDDGKHWQIKKPERWNRGSVIEGGQFADRLHGYAVGMRIFSTSDGGDHWAEIADSGKGQHFTALSFWDHGHGCAASNTMLLFCTQDGGENWSSRRVLPISNNPQQTDGNQFFRMFFVNGGRTGWLLDYEGNFFVSTDGADTWLPYDFGIKK